jgi:hypothetical protein
MKYKAIGGAEPDLIYVNNTSPAARAACEGAFIVRGETVGAGNQPFPQNAILKLGNERPDVTDEPNYSVFEVAPGFDYIGSPLGTTDSTAFIVGREEVNTPNRALTCRAVTINVPDPG